MQPIDKTLLLILLVPFLISFTGVIVLSRWRSPFLDMTFSFNQLWSYLLSYKLSARKIIAFFLITLPLWALGSLVSDFLWVILVLLLIFSFVYEAITQKNKVNDQSNEVLNALEEMMSKLGDSRLHLEYLASLIKVKQFDIDEKERIRTELDQQIGRKTKESEAWSQLTEQQKDQVVQALRKSQSRGVLGTTGIIIGSLTLNLIATLIWTLLGNPGKDELIKRLLTISQLWQH